ncbi:MAG TPA: DUF305 domain-containing protein [Streptosporangiaceae bacterium]|jgi:uncharacterized protein (DUF305 family)|nr:DUF305 domain-containing protein [Streptosporangiaceae bacterium]
MKHRRVTLGAAFVLCIASGGVVGCSGDDERPTSSVVVPNRPGEPNKTVPATKGSAPSPGPADVRFVEMMVPHHAQAVEMAALAPERAASDKVKALADRIGDAQTAEITQMRSWLRRHIRSVHGHGSAAHSMQMPGMATPQQMDQLKSSTGQNFDRLFLTLMITHHQGALTMAHEELTKGTDVLIHEMAQEVVASQTAEINRMRALL